MITRTCSIILVMEHIPALPTDAPFYIAALPLSSFLLVFS